MPARNAAKPTTPAFLKATIEALDGKPTSLEETAQILYATKMGRDVAVVSISEYNGKLGLDVLRFYLSDDEVWKPTAKGLRMPLEIIEPLNEALTAYRRITK